MRLFVKSLGFWLTFLIIGLSLVALLPGCGSYERDYSLPFYTYHPEKLPIVVDTGVMLQREERRINSVLNVAMTWWQTALDTDKLVFSRTSDNFNSFYLPVREGIDNERVLGRIVFNEDTIINPLVRTPITSMKFLLNTDVSPDLSTDRLFVVVLHELGHVLGLRHLAWYNADLYNVMFPAMKLGATRIEEEQLELIREGFEL